MLDPTCAESKIAKAKKMSAIISQTRCLARALAPDIRVNAVAPGFINTAMTQALNESQQQSILSQIPMGRMGEAEDIANAVAFLASKEASYITGTVIHVDGGKSFAT